MQRLRPARFRFILVALLSLSLLFATGCAQSAAGQAKFTLTYQVQGGVAGLNLGLTLDHHGTFTITNKGRQVKQGALTQPEMDSLKAFLAKLRWQDLKATYDPAPQVRDELYYRIALTQGGATHEVTAGSTAQVPQELRDMLNFLEAVRQAQTPAQSGTAAGGGAVTPVPQGPGPDEPVGPRRGLRDSRAGVEAWAEGDALYWRHQGGQPEVVLRLSDLPRDFSPQGAQGDARFGVSTDRFVALALAPDGKSLVFSTGGVHGFLALVIPGAPERLQGLDLGFETDFTGFLWSPDGLYLAVMTAPPSGAVSVSLYNAASGRRLALPALDETFPNASYMITPVEWASALQLRLTIEAAPEAETDAARLGAWLLDVESGRLTRGGGN